MPVTRRSFLGAALTIGTHVGRTSATAQTTQVNPDGYFTLGRRNDHWWLITPDGSPFFSVGLNHIDPASLRG